MRRLFAAASVCLALIIGSTQVSFAQNLYGAIAFSQNTGAVGWSYDYRSRSGAERRALNGCYKHAGDCRVVMWFRNSCGALAVTDRGGYGTAGHPNRYVAEERALDQCYRSNNNCYLKRWVCTGR